MKFLRLKLNQVLIRCDEMLDSLQKDFTTYTRQYDYTSSVTMATIIYLILFQHSEKLIKFFKQYKMQLRNNIK